MKQDKDEQYSILIKAILPQEIFDYFEIVNVVVTDTTIVVHLDELNNYSFRLHGAKVNQ